MLFLLERGDRALEPFGSAWIRRRMFAQDVGVTPQTAPARDDLFERLLGADQLLEFRGERLETGDRCLREHAPAFAFFEGTAGILESPVERRGVLRRHRREVVPLDLQFRNTIDRLGTRQGLDLLADDDAVGLLAGERVRALLFRGALALPLCNRLAHRFAGGFELLRQLGVDLVNIRLELGPRQARLGERCRSRIRSDSATSPAACAGSRALASDPRASSDCSVCGTDAQPLERRSLVFARRAATCYPVRDVSRASGFDTRSIAARPHRYVRLQATPSTSSASVKPSGARSRVAPSARGG